jgi:NADH-quinone oxidoreductase subunit C
MSTQQVIEVLGSRFGGIDFAPAPLLASDKVTTDQVCVRIPPDRLIEVVLLLRDDPQTRFEQLTELSCVDYLHFPNATDRYGVTYGLLSLTHNHRLWVKCFANDPDPVVPSVTGIWAGANWLEREVFDMFGVRFDGHPDLRRILTWDGFKSYPLRKDYPLRGIGEREDYETLTRESS